METLFVILILLYLAAIGIFGICAVYLLQKCADYLHIIAEPLTRIDVNETSSNGGYFKKLPNDCRVCHGDGMIEAESCIYPCDNCDGTGFEHSK